jgi:hypothetical protein
MRDGRSEVTPVLGEALWLWGCAEFSYRAARWAGPIVADIPPRQTCFRGFFQAIEAFGRGAGVKLVTERTAPTVV